MMAFVKAFMKPELQFKLLKNVNIGTKHRMGINQKETKRKYLHRLSCFANYDYDIDDFEINFQTLFQYGLNNSGSTNNLTANALTGGHSLSLSYNWFDSKIKPYAKYKLFHELNHPNDHILNEWKLKTGFKYDLSQNSSMNICYMFKNEFNVAYPSKANA